MVSFRYLSPTPNTSAIFSSNERQMLVIDHMITLSGVEVIEISLEITKETISGGMTETGASAADVASLLQCVDLGLGTGHLLDTCSYLAMLAAFRTFECRELSRFVAAANVKG